MVTNNNNLGKGPEAGSPHNEHEAPGQNKVVNIVVNGRAKEFQGKKITFQQVVTLAFGSYVDNENMIYTVTYCKGDDKKKEGTMVKGDEMPVKDDMEFTATLTDKS